MGLYAVLSVLFIVLVYREIPPDQRLVTTPARKASKAYVGRNLVLVDRDDVGRLRRASMDLTSGPASFI